MKKVVVLLLSLALVGPGAALAEVNGTWSVGVTGQYDLPLFKLKNWFPSGGIDFGGTVSRINNETWTFELTLGMPNTDLENWRTDLFCGRSISRKRTAPRPNRK